MRFFLISDNIDTAAGMRLAGIEGKITHDKTEAEELIRQVMDDPTVGVLLVTPRIADLCRTLINQLRMAKTVPVITEIPDRHGESERDPLADALSEALGIKF